MSLHICVPAHAERDWLPSTLFSLEAQNDRDFQVWICINHAYEDESDPSHAKAVANNRDTLAWIRQHSFGFPLHVIDATGAAAPSRKQAGVGWARRTLFESAFKAGAHVCVSLDADTTIPSDYVSKVRAAFDHHPNAIALTAPYHHPVDFDAENARQTLRYEIYMRWYQVGLWRAGSPYAFLPLGSAMACTRRGYELATMPDRKAGEDFYFLQALRKSGPVIRWIDATVTPAARPSHRVPFGTGHALRQSLPQLQKQFPLYSMSHFMCLSRLFQQFYDLYTDDIDTELGLFLDRIGGLETFRRIRNNVSDVDHFVRSCHQKFDALRTLQFLKFLNTTPKSDFEALSEMEQIDACDPSTDALPKLERTRSQLAQLEASYQRAFMTHWDNRAKW